VGMRVCVCVCVCVCILHEVFVKDSCNRKQDMSTRLDGAGGLCHHSQPQRNMNERTLHLFHEPSHTILLRPIGPNHSMSVCLNRSSLKTEEGPSARVAPLEPPTA